AVVEGMDEGATARIRDLAGNHAQGIAAAAALCGVAAKIVMPADAPHMKLARTRALGAEVITYDRAREDRVAIAGEIADACGGAFVHPFDNRDVIAGQGTAGLEIAADLAARDAVADQVLICCAGGGLSAGVGLAVRDRMPGAEIRTVEPAGFDDFARSLAEGERVSNAAAAGSICDALLVQTPGVRNFEIAKTHFSPGLVVTDEEALAAVRYAFEELKLVVEPGGAVALAVILSGKVATRGRTTVAMLSGGNIDPAVFANAIA
ncbi:MAG: pyridoxal-phosphate dependent enzyme, partial [Pseudomonadota bacterium]